MKPPTLPKPARRSTKPEEGALSPHDPDAERVIVGFLLVDPIETLELLANLSTSDVYTPIFRRALAVARTRQANRLTIDTSSMREDMERIAPLSDAERAALYEATDLNLQHQPDPRNLIHLARRVAELGRQRSAHRVIEEARQALLQADVDSTAQVLGDLEAELSALRAGYRVSTGHLKTWRTPAEILATAAATERTWLWPDVIPFASRSLLIGPPKTAGKSTLLWFLLALATKGATIDGTAIPPTKFVVLTEEGDLELADKLRAFGIDGDAGLVLARPVAGDRPLRENVADALEQAKAIGARILVIDTFVRFAGLGADEENSSSAVAAAIATLEPATEAGLAVILVHHVNRREGASGGDASRGSTALPGAVEAILDLRPSPDPTCPEQRRLHVESRIVGTRDLRLALRRGDGLGVPDRFEVLGTDADVARTGAEQQILELLDREAVWLTGPEIEDRVEARKSAVQSALPRLRREGRVQFKGTGHRGDPMRYLGLVFKELHVPQPTAAPSLAGGAHDAREEARSVPA